MEKEQDAQLQAQTHKYEVALRKMRRELRRLRVAADYSDLFGSELPPELLTPYAIEDLDSHLGRVIQRKYKRRDVNIRRCWNRVELLLPELMNHEAEPHKILEMSTAHGGMLEVLRYFGHDVLGNDYVNLVSGGKDVQRALYRNVNDTTFERDFDDYGLPVPRDSEDAVDWPYKKLIDSINIPMALFDAGQTPYPFDDKAFDVLICMQAIEHYCHPKDWMAILDEFCRITNKTIILLLNPMMGDMGDAPEDYAPAYQQAKLDMQRYRRNGFHCVSCHVLWGEAVGFKFVAS